MSPRREPVIVIRPEKFLTRSCPPARMDAVRSMRSVSCCSDATAGAEVAMAPTRANAGMKAVFNMFFLAVGLDGTPRRRVHRPLSDFQAAGVNGHSDHGVDADAVQPADVVFRRHPAGRRQLSGR